MQKLPQYYVIKRDPSNPLWEKYIKWLSEKAGMAFSGESKHYGYDGNINRYNGYDYWGCITHFANSPNLITLEQWDEAVNGFVLPEKWCVKRNKENYEVINKYFIDKTLNPTLWQSTGCVSYNGESLYGNNEGYTEITFDQFKKHVLKENDMSKEELLAEAKRRYPIGCTVKCLSEIFNNEEIKIERYDHQNCTPNQIWLVGKNKNAKVYHDGKWAEIISKPEPMKDRTITAAQAQSIIDVACTTWKDTLCNMWAHRICKKEDIRISEKFYSDMRKACCTAEQHTLFDSIFGKDKKEFIMSDELKSGEYIKNSANGEIYQRVEEYLVRVFDKNVFRISCHQIHGKKVKIKSIEFEEVND